MKVKLRIVDKISKKGRSTPGGVVTVIEKESRNLEHFEAQKKFRAHIFIDRKKRAKNGYRKYKKPLGEE